MTRILVRTDDGSYTFKVEELGECYHSVRGALQEARDVYLQAGLAYFVSLFPQISPVRIFEMGFGTGLNAWLSRQYADEHRIRVEYTAIETFPLQTEEVCGLPQSSEPGFLALHQSPWETAVPHSEYFSLLKQQEDLLRYALPANIDVVYFDAFAPDVQPDLWSADVFARIYRQMRPGGVLVTYSAKGSVKQALREAGFEVQRLKGSGGKRHMVRGERGNG